MLVDDAQLLDDGSVALVHQLVQEKTCSLVASVRTPGLVPDPVIALWKDGRAERIDLGSWTEAETAACSPPCWAGQSRGAPSGGCGS